MINHITLRVSDLERSKEFFLAALTPLGYKIFIEKSKSIGFGRMAVEGHNDFWIKQGDVAEQKSFGCLAFTAANKEDVQAFYDAALSAGGKDNGAPGYRPQYHAGYYAAFVIDPDGYNIEAVFEDIEKLKTTGEL